MTATGSSPPAPPNTGPNAGASCAATNTGCPHPNLVAVEILDGSDTAVLTAKDLQYVNLPGDNKWNDGTKLKNKDRQTQKPRVRVRFDRPCTESFKIKLDPGVSNQIYSAAEEGRNGNFKHETTEKTYTTDADGTKIITDLQIASAGKDTYKYTAEDNYGNKATSAGEIETIRRIYLQELKMVGVSAASSLNTLTIEFDKHGIEIVKLSDMPMDHIDNVGTDTSNFETSARAAYVISGCSSREPFVVAVTYTDHLAVKETPLPIIKAGVTVGPGNPAVTIPIIVNGKRKSLWNKIVTGESWFISASFRKNGGTAADDVNIPIANVTLVPDAPAVPDNCSSVNIQVAGLATAAQTGTITLTVHVVDRMRAGLAFSGGNLICVCTRAWWKIESTADQNEAMIHEMGHKIGMVPDGSSLDTGSNQYTAKGHVGSHCHTGLAVLPDYSTSSGTCVMFGATSGNSDFCLFCARAVKKVDISAGWSAF
jgi:type VI secretion system secreted protein VgrG